MMQQKRIQMTLDLTPWYRAYHAIEKLAPLVKEERWRAIHTVLTSHAPVLIHVQYGKLHASCIFGCQSVQNRRQSLAMTSPRRIEFQKHRPGKIEHFFLKGSVGNEHRFVGEQTGQRKR